MRTPVHEITQTAESLSVRVELPDVKKASEVDLEISTTRLKLVVPERCAHAEERGTGKGTKALWLQLRRGGLAHAPSHAQLQLPKSREL